MHDASLPLSSLTEREKGRCVLVPNSKCSSIPKSSIHISECQRYGWNPALSIDVSPWICTSSQFEISLACPSTGKEGGKKPKNPFASTILLPETGFSPRANAIIREPEIQKFWKDYDIYNKLSESAPRERYILHDGPPYANGGLHCGHALNKILKDFINRKQVLNGRQVHYIPGWDCHGLPIELKVLQTMKSKERQALTPITLREKAAAFAKETVEQQSKSFQRYGVFGDFEHPYLTLQPEFEAAQIRVFGAMFQKGYIFRGRKPVHWSPSSRTALAEAELEYPEGHVSKSIYVAFEIQEASDAIKEFHSNESPVKVAVWTTTPWTMPANMAVAVNPDLSYSVVENEKTGKLIVATDLIQAVAVSMHVVVTHGNRRFGFFPHLLFHS